MPASEEPRLSVAVVDVHPGRLDDFLTLMRRLAEVMGRKQYGRTEAIRDEAVPARFYEVRHWTSAETAKRGHSDLEMNELRGQLRQLALVTDAIDGTRGVSSQRPVDLVGAARRARDNAAAAFSHFKVGAALETSDGAIVTGCNVENATYGLTVCAERVAMFKALSDGHRRFTRIAIVADTESPTPPCGACRQILWEFGGDLEIQLANLTADAGTYRLKDLLPLPFDARLLDGQ